MRPPWGTDDEAGVQVDAGHEEAAGSAHWSEPGHVLEHLLEHRCVDPNELEGSDFGRAASAVCAGKPAAGSDLSQWGFPTSEVDGSV